MKKENIELVVVNEMLVSLGMKEVKKVESIKVDEVVKEMLEGIESKKYSKSSCIKGLFNIGLEVKEISNNLGIIYNMCYNVISNYIVMNGVEVVKEKKIGKKDIIIKMLEEGKTNMEICKELMSNYNYVLKVKKEWLLSKEVKEENKIV